MEERTRLLNTLFRRGAKERTLNIKFCRGTSEEISPEVFCKEVNSVLMQMKTGVAPRLSLKSDFQTVNVAELVANL